MPPWEKYQKASAPKGPWEKYGATQQAPQAPVAAPEQPSRLASMAMSAGKSALRSLPGAETAFAMGEGKKGLDMAGAVGADVANAALLPVMSAGKGVAGVAKALGGGAAVSMLADALSGISQAAGEVGGDITERVAKNFGMEAGETEYPEVWKNLLARTPRAIGETLGQIVPTALSVAALGQAPRRIKGALSNADTAARTALSSADEARALQQRAYPVTESHAVPGDVRLKQALENPALSAERDAYLKRLEDASRRDYEASLAPPRIDMGPESTGALGQTFQEAAQKALGQRGASYRKMMELAEGYAPGRDVVSGLGERTHAGKALNDRLLSDLAAKGVDVQAVRKKVLMGEPITPYDLKGAPASLAPVDVEAVIKFGDQASQLWARPIDLAEAASAFSRQENLFGKGVDVGGFKFGTRKAALDVAEDLIARSDEATRGLVPPLMPEYKAQRANWAQGADIAEKKGRFMPRRDALGNELRAEMTSPESVFRKDIIGGSGGVSQVRQWKKFLADNGQDAAIVEKMGLDYLDELVGGGKKAVTSDSLKSAWEKVAGGKNAELGREIFSPQTRSAIEGAIKRMELAERPLKVMDTNMRYGSQTGKLGALRQMGKASLGALLGGGVGGAALGPLGAAAGAMVGTGLQKGMEALKTGKQARMLTQAPAYHESMKAASKAKALKSLDNFMSAMQRGIGMNTRDAALLTGKASASAMP